MEDLAEKYRGVAYNLITKNCNHFCNDACIKLTENPISSWVNRLARIGLLCYCVIPVNLNTTKVSHLKIEDKEVCDEEVDEKKKLKRSLFGAKLPLYAFKKVTEAVGEKKEPPVDFIAQLNEGRHLKKRPTEFRVDKVLQPFDENKFNFTKVGQEKVLFQFMASESNEAQFFTTRLALSPLMFVLVFFFCNRKRSSSQLA